jgi:hypothetical protein
MAGGFLSRWQEHQERRIRKLILAHDGRSNERFVSTWNVRKIAGNRRSLILTSEAIYDATMTYGSCKRRTPLVTVRAITTSAVSGHFLIHIDGSYDALYVHRQKKQEIFEAIQRAAAAFGRRVTVAVAEDADLTQLRVRSNAWLDQSSNKAHDSLGLLGSSYILRLLKRWSVGSMEMESVQLTAAAQKFSSRGTAAPRKLLLTQKALYILQGSTCQRRISLKKV